MSLECNLLTGNIGSCTDKGFKGFEQTIKWGNRSEIDLENTVYDAVTGKVSAIAMKAGKEMYDVTVTAQKPFEEFKITGEQKKLGVLFKQEVAMMLKGLSPANAALVNTLSRGEFFAIMPQQGTTEADRYVVMGIESGLRATTPEFAATEGSWTIPFTEEMCDSAGLFLYVGTGGANNDATYAAL